MRLVCRTWASQVNPNPFSVTVMYWVKYFLLYSGGWALFVSFNSGYPGFSSPLEWAFTKDAFQKAILWSLLYEIAGLGCSSGPMNARSPLEAGSWTGLPYPGRDLQITTASPSKQGEQRVHLVP